MTAVEQALATWPVLVAWAINASTPDEGSNYLLAISPCPPCRTVSGKLVPGGTIAYRPPDTPNTPQHGITGSHYNLYRANQNPNNCQCFWQSIGAVPSSKLPQGAIPIEPFTVQRRCP